MSPTTTSVALRRAGTLLVAAALVGGPVTTALAEPSGEPSPTPSVSVTTAAPSGSPTPSASPEPSATVSDLPTTTPSSSSSSPSPSATSTGTGSVSPAPSTSSAPVADPLARSVAKAHTLSSAQLQAAAAPTAPQTAYAADFLARTLAAGGDHYVYPGTDFFDGGNTIDAIIALAASGAGARQMAESLAYLEANLGSYTGADFGELYAGPLAKAILGIQAAGGDPTSVGGHDLVADLLAMETPEGRFSDDSAYGDYSNTIGHSLALVALTRAGADVSVASVDFLVAQQCADGGFRGSLGGATCASDPDATAFAAQALLAVGATAEAGAALDRLAALQNADGSLDSSDGTPNANTTGVAAQAFAAGGRRAELTRAQAFLVSLQYGCASPAALRGGLAFSEDSRSTRTVADSDLRATPQGTLGLSGTSLLSVLAADGATSGTTGQTCLAPSVPTTTPTGSTGSADATVPAGTGAGSGSTDDPAEVASGPDRLAQTGSDLLWPVSAGLVLLVVGGLAVAASRRRGAHA